MQDRYELMMEILLNETNVMQIKNDLQSKVKARVDKKPEGLYFAGANESDPGRAGRG